MRNGIYIPILRNRQVEFKAIEDVLSVDNRFCNCVLPLFEIIQERLRSNSKKVFIDDIAGLLTRLPSVTVFVDIVKETPRSSMAPAVTDFLIRTSRHPEYVQAQFELLPNHKERIIPVVSINERMPDVDRYANDAEYLSRIFPRIAFRIPVQQCDALLPIAHKYAKQGDFVLLDIGRAECAHPMILEECEKLSHFVRGCDLTFVILNNPRSEELKNKDLENDAPIYEINTALETMHSSYLHADGFGDYAGINSSYPSTGGAISPAAVFYDDSRKVFIGFRGRTTQLSEFYSIANSILSSDTWHNLSSTHKASCPGCREIRQIATAQTSSYGNQASWKRYTMEHYLYSIASSLVGD